MAFLFLPLPRIARADRVPGPWQQLCGLHRTCGPWISYWYPVSSSVSKRCSSPRAPASSCTALVPSWEKHLDLTLLETSSAAPNLFSDLPLWLYCWDGFVYWLCMCTCRVYMCILVCALMMKACLHMCAHMCGGLGTFFNCSLTY